MKQVDSTYKEIKKVVSEIDLFYQTVSDNNFLITTFDADYNIAYDSNDLASFMKFLKNTFNGVKSRYIFTYEEFDRYNCPTTLGKSVIVTENNTQYRNVREELTSYNKREKCSVLKNDEYQNVDRRCNLDLNLDLLKIYSQTKDINVCFFDPQTINKTFYFFQRVIVLRNRKSFSQSDMLKFPVDKFAPFHQIKTEIPLEDSDSVIEIYTKGH